MRHLINIKAGEKIQITDTTEFPSTYKLLMAYGVFEGTILKVLRNDSWQQMILLESQGKRIAIRKKDAAVIKVQTFND